MSGMARSSTRHPGMPGSYWTRNSLGDAKTATAMPAERSKRETAFRTAASSSTTNTMGLGGAGISYSAITASFLPIYGQAKIKRRAAVGIIRGPDFPFVCVNDAAADGEAKPHSLLFRGEETLKDLFYFFLRNADAKIGDGYLHRALLQFRSDEQLAF